MFSLSLCIFPFLVFLHLYLSPYTKVEESFNIQAVHDLMTYGIPRHNVTSQLNAQYDHMSFPGAVPRTFVGALLLAGLSDPLTRFGISDRQFLVRATLGCLNALSLMFYAHRARKLFSRTTALCYVFLQASHFHIFYYVSRTLPNMFAFSLTIVALAILPPQRQGLDKSFSSIRIAMFLLAFTAVIFRSEIAILLFCHASYLALWPTRVWRRQPRHPVLHWALITRSIVPGILLGSIFGFCLTVSIDTFFWQSKRYLWPELSAFLSNLFPSDGGLGASAWGVQPWHWYFTNALPRIFLAFPLYFFLGATRFLPLPDTVTDLLIPNIAYVAIYSVLAHKETRFIFPIVPPLVVAISAPVSYIWTRRHKKTTYKLLNYFVISTTLISALIAHLVLLPLSALSYPGANALNALHQHIQSSHKHNSTQTQTPIRIHLDNLSTQTGITRFLQHSSIDFPEIIYNKSENTTSLLSPLWWSQFDYAILESPALAIGAWEPITTIHGLGKVSLVRPDHTNTNTDANTGLDIILSTMYHPLIGKASALLRGIVRDGLGVGWFLGEEFGWTRGYWIDVGWVPRLYVLRREESVLEGALDEEKR